MIFNGQQKLTFNKLALDIDEKLLIGMKQSLVHPLTFIEKRKMSANMVIILPFQGQGFLNSRGLEL